MQIITGENKIVVEENIKANTRVCIRQCRIWVSLLVCLAVNITVFGQEGKLPVATDLSSHGITQADLNRLDALMLDAINNQKIISGCSFIVAHEGEIVYKKAHGAFSTDEQVLLASVSKPFAASTIMILVDQGRLKLDDPVENYLPEFQGIKVEGTGQLATPLFTTRHLLAHCAGFWGNKNITAEKLDLIRNGSRTLEEAVLGIAEYDLIRNPNTAYTYSGSGYCIAGRVAEVALGGQSFEKICQDNLFGPLGLDRTSYNPTASSPFILVGGSLNTTLDDMAVFGQMQLNGGVYNGTRILSEASMTEIRRKQIPEPERDRAYGLGWFRYEPDENGLATHVVHGGATGTNIELNWQRQTVTAFLVRSDGPTVADLKNGLNDIVKEIFSEDNDPDIPYALSVNSGTGDGSYTKDTEVIIAADAPPSANYVFDQWTGDVTNVADVNDDTTTITMPAAAVILTATYKEESISSVNSSQTDVPIIYPNPTDGFVNIETTQASQVQVFNVAGQTIYNNREAATSHYIDVSNWKSEVYFVNIQCPGKVYCKKLIVNEIRE